MHITTNASMLRISRIMVYSYLYITRSKEYGLWTLALNTAAQRECSLADVINDMCINSYCLWEFQYKTWIHILVFCVLHTNLQAYICTWAYCVQNFIRNYHWYKISKEFVHWISSFELKYYGILGILRYFGLVLCDPLCNISL